MKTELWSRPLTIERNNFKHKSLSCWSCNIAVGCEHACRFCYVPEVSTNRMAGTLKKWGVKDPDEEWGEYVFLRPWNKDAFRHSVCRADVTPIAELNADGNRAVMFCTTTDPYQVLRGELQQARKDMMREALTCILEHSTLNVRILTRSPLARQDFDLMKRFGPRLLFGMSIPTLNNQLARIYEPKAPAPTLRLATLQLAKEAGLHVYAAIAPVYPDCNAEDMRATVTAIKALDPVTIFMEPINIRAQNVERIETHARKLGVQVKTDVFMTRTSWIVYALQQMLDFEYVARDLGIPDSVLHLWPDASLGKEACVRRGWVESQWNKISAWPK